jgi:hypothetical protein
LFYPLKPLLWPSAISWYRQYGMPIKKVGGIWLGDRKLLDGWFAGFTAIEG